MPPSATPDGTSGSAAGAPAPNPTPTAPVAEASTFTSASTSADNNSHNPIATTSPSSTGRSAQNTSTPAPTSAPVTTSPSPSRAPPFASPLPSPSPRPANPQTAGTPNAASTNPRPAPGTPNPAPRRNQRPLSSVSFFVPFGGQQGGDGPQVGLSWTLEVFGNEADANASMGVPPVMGVPPAAGGNEAAPAADGEHAPAPGEQPPAPTEDAPAGQANPNPNPNPNQGNGDGARSIFFIVGPDGTLRRGDGTNVDDAAAAPPPFPFAFPFPFPFAPGPPPPDPAKAAELLASLPTVGRALLKRVDKIVAAEDGDSSGWQCGVCLEGIDLGEPVKALPCNHLFHGACLQPWFTNHHHTCPTCRLDLDPLRTLHEPARRAPLRPTTTGSGRGTPAGRAPHPYTRPGSGEGRRSRPGSTVAGSDAPTQPGTPQNEPAAGAGGPERLEVPTNPLDAMFDLARMFGLTASPAPMREGEQRQAGGQVGNEGAPANAPAPNAEAGTSAQPGDAGEAAAAASPAPATGAEGPPPRRMPERRRHITIFHIDNNGIHHHHHHEHAHEHHAHGDAGPGAGPAGPGTEGAGDAREETPAAGPDAPAVDGSGAPPAPPPGFLGGGIFAFPPGQPLGPLLDGGVIPPLPRPNAEGDARPAAAADGIPPPFQFTFDFNGGDDAAAAAPPAPAAEAPGAAEAVPAGPGAPPANGANTGTINFPFELLFMRPPGAGGPPGAGEQAPPENQAAPERTFVPQSLESWTAQREKTLGWRCDAVECQIAPPVPDAESMDVDADDAEAEDATAADKEMLAIYSEQQAPFPPRSDVETEPHTGQEFVLIACSHRWHRACLETAARSAGHTTTADASGREWIRCARCRKEGWIVPRESESEPAKPQAVELAL